MPGVYRISANGPLAAGLQSGSDTMAHAEQLAQQRQSHEMEMASAAEDLEARKLERKIRGDEYQRELKARGADREVALAMIRDSGRAMTEDVGEATDAMGRANPTMLGKFMNQGLRAMQQQDPSAFLPPELRAHSRTLERMLKEGNLSPEAAAYATQQYQQRASQYLDQRAREKMSANISRSISSGQFGEDEAMIEGARGLVEMLNQGVPVAEVAKLEFSLRQNYGKDLATKARLGRALDSMQKGIDEAHAGGQWGPNVDAAEEYMAQVSSGTFPITADTVKEFQQLLRGEKAPKVTIPGTDIEVQDHTGITKGGYVGDMTRQQRAELELQARQVVMQEVKTLGDLGQGFDYEAEVAKRILSLGRSYGWKADPLMIEGEGTMFDPVQQPKVRGKAAAPEMGGMPASPDAGEPVKPKGEAGMREQEVKAYGRGRKSVDIAKKVVSGEMGEEEFNALSPAEQEAAIKEIKRQTAKESGKRGYERLMSGPGPTLGGK